ncbi:hypothetical protein ACFFSY_10595 [Paenibacillus aurantiacus]|uniref:Nucleotidase n=1 Tax=Paenibacillus aurantiacus TaxID=1936118 RepID=A0ABV5KQG1_9BACL
MIRMFKSWGQKKLHIGIDLDNTVLDATSSYLHFYNKASGLSYSSKDVTDFYFYRLYGWNNTEREKVYHQYGRDIHWNSSPFPHAIEVLQELSLSHQISIITARPLLFRDVTIDWLKHHGVRYDNIAFTENKLQECIDSEVSVLVDDAPHYAKEFADKNIPVILFEQPYNTSVKIDTVYRASNWLEVRSRISALQVSLR